MWCRRNWVIRKLCCELTKTEEENFVQKYSCSIWCLTKWLVRKLRCELSKREKRNLGLILYQARKASWNFIFLLSCYKQQIINLSIKAHHMSIWLSEILVYLQKVVFKSTNSRPKRLCTTITLAK
jgi:hypothetical protein